MCIRQVGKLLLFLRVMRETFKFMVAFFMYFFKLWLYPILFGQSSKSSFKMKVYLPKMKEELRKVLV